MLAVVILGLGILGMSALFAGAAKQQQTSTQVVRSVVIAQNVKALLERKLGFLECSNNPSGVRQWAWIRSLRSDNPSLTALDVSTITPSGTSFFRVTSPKTELYSAPADFMGGPPQGAAGMGQYDSNNPSPPFNNSAVSDFPHERVIPSTLTIRVTVSEQGGTFGGGQTFDFFVQNPPSDICDESTTSFQFTLNGAPNTSDSITVDLGQLLPNGATQNAFIQSFSLNGLFAGAGANPWISKIEALPYDWRSTKLLSINERLSYVDDGRFPPLGLRPEVGYILFFRQFGEINQAMVVTYALQPQSRPHLNNDQFPLIPPDDNQTFMNNQTDSLVRETTVEIGWDATRNQYFVQADVQQDPDTDESWVAQPGQILLMKKNADCNSSSGDGADGVVHVISQSVDPASNGALLRGYLDDAPRTNLAAVVPQDATTTPQTVCVYALQPEIANADPQDDTRWKIRPVDARLIPIDAQ